jgi:predicted secreted protein
MTEASFIDWIQSLNKIMRSKKRHIILFLDNATSHSHELQLSNGMMLLSSNFFY